MCLVTIIVIIIIILFRSVDQVVLVRPFLVSKERANTQCKGLFSADAEAGAGSCTRGRIFIDLNRSQGGKKTSDFQVFSQKLWII